MSMKTGLVWTGICLALIPLAYASGLFSDIKPNDLRAKSRGLYKLASMLVGCELDNKCMQMTLTEVIKTDPHPIYEEYLAELNKNKDQIEFEQVNCNTPVVRSYRRELTICLMNMLKTIDPKKGITSDQKERVEMNLNQCIVQRMTSSAKQGNLYAQSALMNRALENKDENTFNYWYNQISHQKTTIEYASYRNCQTPLEIIEILPKQEEGEKP